MEFLEYTKKMNDKVIVLQNTYEDIMEADVIKAISYLNNMYVGDVGDCLIFLASLNLCNSYVKKNKDGISYTFKKGIGYILNVLNSTYIEDIYVNVVHDKGKLYIFQIGNIQFSFHDEKNVEIDSRYLKELSWDGVRKQRCAKTIFELAINNKSRVSNITYDGESLENIVCKLLDDYKDNNISFDELTRFKL